MDSHESSRGESLTPEQHRGRLVHKLNCLIAVLEVAIQKVHRSQGNPDENQERLEKIRANLENTLAICKRARTTLEERAPGGAGADMGPLPQQEEPPKRPTRQKSSGMSYRDYVELSSVREFQKFKKLPPIGLDEVRGQDLEELIRKLLAG